ncbi:MAG: site-specific integrase [Saprospiraceae bacterium]|nr:site-specific integrase [Saprospiraceae bacterium]
MKSTKTFSISFLPRKSKADPKLGIIYARISINNTRVEYSIKRKVPFETWDQKRGRCTAQDQHSKFINQYLAQVNSEIFEAYDQLRKEGVIITADSIKARWLGEDSKGHSLLEVVEYHYKIAVTTIKVGTLKNYRTTEKYIKLFLNEELKVDDIYLKQLRYSFITKFENFLRLHRPLDHQRKMENNTVMKHLQRFRKIISLAVRLEWIERDPFANYKTKYIRNERVYLRQEELDAIERKVFSIDRLGYVRDLFVFSCYTGLSYIDAISLRMDQVVLGIDGSKWIFTSRQKTGNVVKIPLLEKAEMLIIKYKDSPKSIYNGTVFPKISNQKLNTYLKEIADVCGIRKNISFHIARHTFATTITLTNGVPLATVSKLLGHSKIASTQIYAKVIESKLSEDMADLRMKLDENTRKEKGQKDTKIINVS